MADIMDLTGRGKSTVYNDMKKIKDIYPQIIGIPAVGYVWREKESEEQTTTYKAKCYSIDEIIDRGYNIDLCGYPHKEEIILEPKELIEQYQEQRSSLNAEIDKILAEVSKLLEEE